MLLIKNARLANSSIINILIDNGRIRGIGTGLKVDGGHQEIEADGRWLFAGGIDPHIHSRFPGQEQKEDIFSLEKAAFRGGTTLVFDMPNTKPPTIDRLCLSIKKKLASQSFLDFKFWFGGDGRNFEELEWASRQAEVIGVKLYLASKDLPGHEESMLRKIFKKCAELGMMIAVHAESKKIIERNLYLLGRAPTMTEHSFVRSEEAEIDEVRKVIELAIDFNTPVYFCHLTTPDAVRLVWEAKQEGSNFFVEVCPHHLIFDDFLLFSYKRGFRAGYFKTLPPLRKRRTVEKLIAAVIDGEVDCVGSDHAPHAREEKERQEYDSIPNGLPGVEFRVPLIWQLVVQGQITPKRFEELIAGNAASFFKLHDREEIGVGKKADLFILDPQKEWTITGTLSKCGWTPYLGLKLRGDVVLTIKDGQIVYDGRSTDLPS